MSHAPPPPAPAPALPYPRVGYGFPRGHLATAALARAADLDPDEAWIQGELPPHLQGLPLLVTARQDAPSRTGSRSVWASAAAWTAWLAALAARHDGGALVPRPPRRPLPPEALQALFRRELRAYAGLGRRLDRTRLVLVPGAANPLGTADFRSVAWATQHAGGGTVALLQRALALPPENLVAVLRHELGHLTDPDLEAPGCEQRADDLAAQATGGRLYYDAADLQTTDPAGVWPRPRHLHR